MMHDTLLLPTQARLERLPFGVIKSVGKPLILHALITGIGCEVPVTSQTDGNPAPFPRVIRKGHSSHGEIGNPDHPVLGSFPSPEGETGHLAEVLEAEITHRQNHALPIAGLGHETRLESARSLALLQKVQGHGNDPIAFAEERDVARPVLVPGIPIIGSASGQGNSHRGSTWFENTQGKTQRRLSLLTLDCKGFCRGIGGRIFHSPKGSLRGRKTIDRL